MTLELKIPPVPLVLLFWGAMWVASVQLPILMFVLPGKIAISFVLGGAGIILAIAGVVEFRKAMTTVNPMQPDTTSVLVTSGVYRFTRNPMYVGLLLVLGGWAIFLSHVLGLLFLPAFIAYINRYQISPEENALSQKFGKDFADYKHSVRRWL